MKTPPSDSEDKSNVPPPPPPEPEELNETPFESGVGFTTYTSGPPHYTPTGIQGTILQFAPPKVIHREKKGGKSKKRGRPSKKQNLGKTRKRRSRRKQKGGDGDFKSNCNAYKILIIKDVDTVVSLDTLKGYIRECDTLTGYFTDYQIKQEEEEQQEEQERLEERQDASTEDDEDGENDGESDEEATELERNGNYGDL